MKKFNRKLSQLEAIYQIAGPVLKPQVPIELSTTIQAAFENASLNVDDDWLINYAVRDPRRATIFIQRLLQESGTLVSKKSIFECIQTLKVSNGKA